MAKSSQAKKSNRFTGIKIKSLLLPIAIVIVVLALGLLKDQFVVASVNREQINRIELIRALEKKEGKNALEGIINERLIIQEAKKKKIIVSDNEINDEISKIEKSIKDQGQNLDDLLALQGLTKQQLKEEVKTQLLLRKLVGKVEVSDKEIYDFIEQNKASLPQDAKPEDLRSQAKAQLEQDKINQKIQSLVENLRKKAKIEYFLGF